MYYDNGDIYVEMNEKQWHLYGKQMEVKKKSKIEINHHVVGRENQSVLAIRASGALFRGALFLCRYWP